MPPTVRPVIPETITVHLGPPDSLSENITVPFVDYIKNVASSEIYPTWPEAALRANIYAIISFALNRVFTEYYPSRGYDFDITNSTQFDQAYIKDRETFENIGYIVDEIFNDYIIRSDSIQPLFTSFCNGTTSTCNGLSQWGSVELAEQGLTSFQILQRYYGNDIAIVENATVASVEESYPGVPLKLGSIENNVRIFQLELNRIGQNYPAIPEIKNPDGIFGEDTERAVRAFQEIFNLEVTGEVDKSTWYAIKRYYAGVKSLSELTSEGVTLEEAGIPFAAVLSLGIAGDSVRVLQYYLTAISYFNDNLYPVPITGVFDSQTENAVKDFQSFYGLPVTGVVNNATWSLINRIYEDTVSSLPPGYSGENAKLYPGYFLTPGIRNSDVEDLQTYLSFIGQNIPELPVIPVTGYYGEQTQYAVSEIQRLFGLPITGSVGPETWYIISNQYDLLKALESFA